MTPDRLLNLVIRILGVGVVFGYTFFLFPKILFSASDFALLGAFLGEAVVIGFAYVAWQATGQKKDLV